MGLRVGDRQYGDRADREPGIRYREEQPARADLSGDDVGRHRDRERNGHRDRDDRRGHREHERNESQLRGNSETERRVEVHAHG